MKSLLIFILIFNYLSVFGNPTSSEFEIPSTDWTYLEQVEKKVEAGSFIIAEPLVMSNNSLLVMKSNKDGWGPNDKPFMYGCFFCVFGLVYVNSATNGNRAASIQALYGCLASIAFITVFSIFAIEWI
jgi:hypothetical protein